MPVIVSPSQQNINAVFSDTTYWIDFYQRDYKWESDTVLRLLDDLFYKFNLEYVANKKLDPNAEVISAKYSWYYLNTYVTNIINGRTYIVDGQQRLTTLSLILVKLFHLSKKYNSKLSKWIESKIIGQTGFEVEFWMNHVKQKKTQKILLEGTDIKKAEVNESVTDKNLIANFGEISKYLDTNLNEKHKFETFVFYFLTRIVLINLLVDQTDVPMVFEVINDRGVRLRPYEILKGKLLGQIDKLELEIGKYNEIWEMNVNKLNKYNENAIDEFFTYFLKSKFASNRKSGQKFEGNYHRQMFDSEVNDRFHINHDASGVKTFLKEDFPYYTNLYEIILKNSATYNKDYPYVFYNNLNDMDSQHMLILSGCTLNDETDLKKINLISNNLDKAFSLLQLQNCYDSNSFNDMVYSISKEIRDGVLEKIENIFDKHIIKEINKQRNTITSTLFSYSYFKNTGINLNSRFKRYFFARIENFLADNMNLKMRHDFEHLVKKTGSVTGFHVEHILSYNDQNLKIFKNDEDLFEQERNRLGSILLLKGRDNSSSGNETYKEKLKSYSNTLYWNESLRSDFYKSKLDFKDFYTKNKLNFEPYLEFGPNEIEKRQKLLFKISKMIWNVS